MRTLAWSRFCRSRSRARNLLLRCNAPLRATGLNDEPLGLHCFACTCLLLHRRPSRAKVLILESPVVRQLRSVLSRRFAHLSHRSLLVSDVPACLCELLCECVPLPFSDFCHIVRENRSCFQKFVRDGATVRLAVACDRIRDRLSESRPRGVCFVTHALANCLSVVKCASVKSLAFQQDTSNAKTDKSQFDSIRGRGPPKKHACAKQQKNGTTRNRPTRKGSIPPQTTRRRAERRDHPVESGSAEQGKSGSDVSRERQSSFRVCAPGQQSANLMRRGRIP